MRVLSVRFNNKIKILGRGKSLMISLAIRIQRTSVTDRRTDTSRHVVLHLCTASRNNKIPNGNILLPAYWTCPSKVLLLCCMICISNSNNNKHAFKCQDSCIRGFRHNNNNNNNTHDNVYSAVIMTTGHCESSLGSFDECRPAPSSRRPSDQAA